MAQNALFGTPNQVSPMEKLPPEERFWKRYSPHHECPLSSVTSIAVHGLILAVLLGGAWLLAKLGWSGASKPPPVDAVVIVGGGGGNPTGLGNGPGDVQPVAPQEAVAQPSDEPKKPVAPVARPELPNKEDIPPAPVKLPDLSEDAHLKRWIAKGAFTAKALSELDEETREKLRHGAVLSPGQGEGGKGSGGGLGKGNGPGEGDGAGPGKGNGNPTIQEKRRNRWHMVFHTGDGEEYVRELSYFRAIIAVPVGPERYKVYRDLRKRPVQGEVEDLGQFTQLCWTDQEEQSVVRLAKALGLRSPPNHFRVYFPAEFETKLLDLELKFRSQDEKNLELTLFEVIKVGVGKYEPRVVAQR